MPRNAFPSTASSRAENPDCVSESAILADALVIAESKGEDTVRAGELLVESLIALVDGKSAQSQRLPTELVVRRSSTAD